MNELLSPRAVVQLVPDADEHEAEPLVLAVPVFSGPDGPELPAGLPAEMASRLGSSSDDRFPIIVDPGFCRQQGFTAKTGQSMLVPASGDRSVVWVGCGEPGKLDPEALRNAGAAMIRGAGESPALMLLLPVGVGVALEGQLAAGVSDDGMRAAAQALVEGAVLASYRYDRFRTDPQPTRPARLLVHSSDESARAVVAGVNHGDRVARAVCFARDLVNEPPSSLTPRRLAEIALSEVGAGTGVQVEVWDEERITAEHLGGLLGVARGSAEPPRLVRATYEPAEPLLVDGRVPHVVLVGKGITFDSGGLSLKTADGMTTMKTDMSGAAAVLATISACGELGVRVRVTGIAPVTENMPGGRATKPGDVLTIRDGQTIEVLNTDAEGRLVLADGLTLAKELEPDAIVDLATLTGACVVALGGSIAGMMGNDEDLIARVGAASLRSGEPSWPLPLPDDYSSHIESEIADMKNVGKAGQAGAISAALLLARFVGDVPWVHMDIAGPARSNEDAGYRAKGGTGFGVRTLLELLATWGS